MIFSFDRFSVDTQAYELRCDGQVRDVEPLVFNLIAHFLAHPDTVFSRDALIEAVWQGRIVSDSTVATCVKNARKALGDTGDAQAYIQTVRGRGYRFRADVVRTGGDGPTVATPAGDDYADPLLLILPFQPLSDEPRSRRLAGTLAADLGAILTRVPLLRLSTQANHYEGRLPRPTALQVHEDFGVDFVLDGSVQEGAGAVKAIVQLDDARTGYRLWAESFEQDDLLAAIVGKLEPQLHRAMYAAMTAVGEAPSARQLFLQASGLLVMQGWNPDSFIEADALLRRSCELDPEFALAPALQSLLHGFGARIGLAADPMEAAARARQKAERALQLESMDSVILGLAGCSLADIGELDRGEALLRNAIDLNPANAQAWVALGTVRMAHNDFSDAVVKLTKGIEMSPMDSRLSVWGALLACARLMSGDAVGACEVATTACRRHDGTYLPRIVLAAARLAQDESERALDALKDARRIKPDLNRSQIEAIVGARMCDALLSLGGQ